MTVTTSPLKARSKRKVAPPAASLPVRKPAIAKQETIAAAQAKAHLLRLLDEVEQTGRAITITKRGRVVAQLVPSQQEAAVHPFDQVFGSLKNTIKIHGDIVSPDWECWGDEWR